MLGADGSKNLLGAAGSKFLLGGDFARARTVPGGHFEVSVPRCDGRRDFLEELFWNPSLSPP